MPTTPTFPGVYVEEIPSGVRTITGVATSITAFIGSAERGPENEAVTINSFGDFEKQFGGLSIGHALGFAVRDFFLNGGSKAIIVRLFHQPTAASTGGTGGTGTTPPASKFSLSIGERAAARLTLEAASSGRWATNLRAAVDTDNISEDVAKGMGLKKEDLFNLTVSDASPGGKVEKFLNLTVKEDSPRRIDSVLASSSTLVRYKGKLPTERVVEGSDELSEKETKLSEAKIKLFNKQNTDPNNITTERGAVKDAETKLDNALDEAAKSVSDALPLTVLDFLPKDGESKKEGMFALEQADLFNILCIPPYKPTLDVDLNLVSAAAAYCEKRRAMLIVDSPASWNIKDGDKNPKDTAKKEFTDPDDKIGTRSRNAALFFPRVRQPNPLRDNQFEDFAACGAIAGIMARTDTQRGVWKAPAGLDATLVGVPALSVSLTDDENGELNPLGINCLRAFSAGGRVVWGARTLRGNDQLADEYKFIPVRRTALYIEESLYRGLKWVVFEPNDEPLWSQIRLNVGAFMQNLFRQGAFQGTTPKDAYFVKCDKETNPQNDINLGIVNVIVGFAPLKPAEFVIIKLQQMAGQIET